MRAMQWPCRRSCSADGRQGLRVLPRARRRDDAADPDRRECEPAEVSRNPMQATAISFAVGALRGPAGSFALRARLAVDGEIVGHNTAGCGSVVCLVPSMSSPHRRRAQDLATAVAVPLAIAGQVIVALMLDHFGWLGFPQSAISPLKLAGALMVIGGVALIAYAKQQPDAWALCQSPHCRGGANALIDAQGQVQCPRFSIYSRPKPAPGAPRNCVIRKSRNGRTIPSAQAGLDSRARSGLARMGRNQPHSEGENNSSRSARRPAAPYGGVLEQRARDPS